MEEKAHHSDVDHKHEPEEEAINIVEDGNNVLEISSAKMEKSMAYDSTDAEEIVELSQKEPSIQADVVGTYVHDGWGEWDDGWRQEEAIAEEDGRDWGEWDDGWGQEEAAAEEDGRDWGKWDDGWGQEEAAAEEDGRDWGEWDDGWGQEEAAAEEDGRDWGEWDDGWGQEEAATEENGRDWGEWDDGWGHGDATENDEFIAEALYMEELKRMEDGGIRGFEEPYHADVFSGANIQQANANHDHPIGGEETITMLLEPLNKDVMISARQEVLACASSCPALLTGVEEVDDEDQGWYNSIAHDAQRMEEMDDPELYDNGVSFHKQLQRSESPAKVEPYYSPTKMTAEEEDLYHEFSLENFTKKWNLNPSELDPEDKPGPSTKRQMRVPPLTDDEVATFHCGICIETLPVLDLFHGMQCDHEFCVECMATYIEGRVQAGEVPIPCPNPKCLAKDEHDYSGLHPEECKKSIDFAVFSNWGDRLMERAIPPSRRAYCPNSQCGVMLETTGGKTPAMTFCPVCCHAMCAACGLDWSADESGEHDCTEGPDAALLKKLAVERRWKQCPKCRMLVESTGGCSVMKCRCSFSFCYVCGGAARGREQEETEEMCHCADRSAMRAHGLQ